MNIQVRKRRWWWEATDFDWIGGEMESSPRYHSRTRQGAIDKLVRRNTSKVPPWEPALEEKP